MGLKTSCLKGLEPIRFTFLRLIPEISIFFCIFRAAFGHGWALD